MDIFAFKAVTSWYCKVTNSRLSVKVLKSWINERVWFCQKVLELASGKKVIGKLVHNRVLGLLSRHENLLMTQIIENDLTVIIQIRTILWLKIPDIFWGSFQQLL